MRALIQRVRQGSVSVGDEMLAQIGRGYVVFLGVGRQDQAADADWLADRVVDLRLFSDGAGRTNLALPDVDGEVLVVSQFTLYADAQRGRRPSFTDAAPPEVAVPLYERFVTRLRERGCRVATGRFGADMLVMIANDGPVTIWLERATGDQTKGGDRGRDG